ncbi:MAG: hypothetical protein ACRD2H_14240 [Terriglobales bacterium]
MPLPQPAPGASHLTRSAASWLGLALLAAGACLLLFPYLPAFDRAGRMLAAAPHWPAALGCLAASVVLLAAGRRARR